MIKHITTTPAKALEKLKAGNARYIDAKVNSEDISQAKRTDTLVTVRSLMRLLLPALIPA